MFSVKFLYTGDTGARIMTQITRLSTLNLDCESTYAQLHRWFTYYELRVVRSFDLQSACASFTDLTCPHHGDSSCDCQLVVLLVYGTEAAPASIVLHSHRGKTDVDLVDSPNNRPDQDLKKMIRLAFDKSVGSSLLMNQLADVP
jgi:hypothetical protein